MTKKIKVIYLRVSDEESERKDQLPLILSRFDLIESECLILEETISAYNEEVQKNRLAFIKLRELVDNNVVSDLYVFSTERIERNMIRFFEFFFFCEAKGCRIHSVLQPMIDYEFDNSLMSKYARYNQVLLLGFIAENESWLISERTKKAFDVSPEGVGVSRKGNAWGDNLRDLNGNRIQETTVEMKNEVYSRVQHLLKRRYSQSRIIKDIGETYKVSISPATISRIRRKKICVKT